LKIVYRSIKSSISAVQACIDKYIRLNEEIQELSQGQVYEVIAIERRDDGGLWYFVHATSGRMFPSAYPAEIFDISDGCLRDDWIFDVVIVDGIAVFRSAGFPEWVTDPNFFSKLIDQDEECKKLYTLWLSALGLELR